MSDMNQDRLVEVAAKGTFLVRDGEVAEIGIQEGYAGPHIHLVWDLDCEGKDDTEAIIQRAQRRSR